MVKPPKHGWLFSAYPLEVKPLAWIAGSGVVTGERRALGRRVWHCLSERTGVEVDLEMHIGICGKLLVGVEPRVKRFRRAVMG